MRIPSFLNRFAAGGRHSTLALSLALGVFSQSLTDQPALAQAAGDFVPDKSAMENWANFRGPGGIGRAMKANPPLKWDVKEGKNILWKTKVPKPGLNSPVVWGNRLFLTGADEASRQVFCFATETGELLWQHEVKDIPGSPSGDQLPSVLEECGLAAPTAITDGRLVAAIFGTGDLICLSVTGERVWARNLGVPRNHYGHASSLIHHENLLFVQYDQRTNSTLLAFELASGKLAWRIERGAISWASPILVDNRGRMELILANSKAVDSYDPKTGKPLWHVECLDAEVASSAAFADGIVCVANENASARAIEVGNHASEPKILWSWDEALPDASSPLAHEKYLFIPSAFGAVHCLDLKTGRVLWAHDFEVGFYSSPILVNDRVYITDLSGTVRIFKMADQFELLASVKVGEDVYATPAFAGRKIFVRGITHLFCFEERE